MLKYLIIQLDDTSVSFCHYNNDKNEGRLIGIETLERVLLWSMKENLTVQFLYPDYILPAEYKDLISSVYHADIVSSSCEDKDLLKNADVVVLDSWKATDSFHFSENQAYIVRSTFDDLIKNFLSLVSVLPKVSRLNVVITDFENLTKDIEERYSKFLEDLNSRICEEYKNNHNVQLNILTDRIMLNAMNNCGAGEESITIAPDGKFYVCPGFYIDGSNDVGNIDTGLDIKNQQLYRLDYAPICRRCDAWHCKRCVWQNKKFTLEVNTPGREQCVTAHLERNASRDLLSKIRGLGIELPNIEIPVISYLDPFDEIVKKG